MLNFLMPAKKGYIGGLCVLGEDDFMTDDVLYELLYYKKCNIA